MKLITKLTLSYLLVSGLVFILGSFISYKTMESKIEAEQFWELQKSFNYIVERIDLGVPAKLLNSDKISIIELPPSTREKALVISDTMVLMNYNGQLKSHKKGTWCKKIQKKVYQISIHNIIIEGEDISDATTISLSIVFGLLLLLVCLSGLILSKTLLKPFHQTLETIQAFDLAKNTLIELPPSKTKEFNQLNEFLYAMSQKAQQEYQSLKSFSENASHEMQTPLAIVKGKLELLLNTTLNIRQTQLVEASYNAMDRLAQLNKTLTLLTKVDNYEFTAEQMLNFSQLLKETVYDYEDIIRLQGLSLTIDIIPNVELQIHESLAFILISNLLSNAIKHNLPQNGEIVVALNKEALVIKNTGPTLKSFPKELFKRFKKDNQSSTSIGLGLAIIKSICDKNDLKIDYRIQGEWHLLELTF